jgi:predicted MPP superfamily phosphohydrolase
MFLITFILFALVLLIFFAVNDRLAVRYYEINSNELNDCIRIAFVADLHSCYYGEGQAELLDRINAQQPDLILLGGDIVDDKLPRQNAIIVLKALAEKYPCFYVSGNHEFWSGEVDRIKQMIAGYGITILEGQNQVITINGQLLNICGIDDAEIGAESYMQQIVKADHQTEPDLFTIFMAHRPEYIDTYLQYDFDLILSGHAHGGQWRIPGVLNGFISPNQGFFPEYAGGEYVFDHQTFIVSRGLAKESTRVPRIFNPPELVIIDIVPTN